MVLKALCSFFLFLLTLERGSCLGAQSCLGDHPARWRDHPSPSQGAGVFGDGEGARPGLSSLPPAEAPGRGARWPLVAKSSLSRCPGWQGWALCRERVPGLKDQSECGWGTGAGWVLPLPYRGGSEPTSLKHEISWAHEVFGNRLFKTCKRDFSEGFFSVVYSLNQVLL